MYTGCSSYQLSIRAAECAVHRLVSFNCITALDKGCYLVQALLVLVIVLAKAGLDVAGLLLAWP
jgi:hypothetical protein